MTQVFGMAFNEVAQAAYAAYCANTDNKNFRGEPCPAWEALPPHIQTAWEAQARHLGGLIEAQRPESILDAAHAQDPSRWNGWKSPTVDYTPRA